jgi:hypothetical protein
MKIFEAYYSHYSEMIDGTYIGGSKFFMNKKKACAYRKSLRKNYRDLQTEAERSGFRTHVVEREVIE